MSPSSIDLSYAGTVLPGDLILIHKFRDHYSLQGRKEMTVKELNAKSKLFWLRRASDSLGTNGCSDTPQAAE
ncbi:hypothetical protein N7463_001804 [Penicillium fimorum]|uniref:Tse2 ADP-ribosyltransferase toxin domain-containing protein n=1 Tax=Penicillium fimorum TaxID=1882269 RepID=A0A9X0C7T9_9EURO|nr:hypothetical protein N7463_001804 [Penicillium fimorum]